MSLSFKQKYSYGIGALGKDLVYAVVATYLMFYFTDLVGLSPTFAGGLFLVARLWDAINDPAMGVIVDNTRSKYGKFRPWILIGTIINAVVLVLLFTRPNLEGVALHVYFAVVYILWGMTYTIMDIPYWSMIPSLSKNPAERDKVAVIPRIFASLGWLIIGSFGLILVDKLGNGNQITGFKYLSVVIAVVFVITSLITCINVKDESCYTATEKVEKKEKVNLKQAFSIIKQNDQLMVFIGIVLTFNIMAQLVGGLAIYYFKYVIGQENLVLIFTGVASIAEMTALFLYPKLSSYLGKTKIVLIACVLPAIGFILLLTAGFIAPKSAIIVAVAGTLFKLGSGLTLGATTVMLADVVDYGEYKLGTRNESIIFSVQTLLVKSASALSGWLIGVGLSIIGYIPNVQQTEGTILGIRVLMMGIPSVLTILSFVIYKKYYKINGDYHKEILTTLDKKRAI